MTDGTAARQLVAAALEVALEQVPPDGDVETVPQWDSLGHMKVLLALEDRLGRTLAPAELANIRGVEDIATLLARTT